MTTIHLRADCGHQVVQSLAFLSADLPCPTPGCPKGLAGHVLDFTVAPDTTWSPVLAPCYRGRLHRNAWSVVRPREFLSPPLDVGVVPPRVLVWGWTLASSEQYGHVEDSPFRALLPMEDARALAHGRASEAVARWAEANGITARAVAAAVDADDNLRRELRLT